MTNNFIIVGTDGWGDRPVKINYRGNESYIQKILLFKIGSGAGSRGSSSGKHFHSHSLEIFAVVWWPLSQSQSLWAPRESLV